MNPEPKKRNPIGWPFWLLLIGIILILYSFAPMQLTSKKELADRMEAKSNATQIALALFEFNEEFGSYPSPSSAADVTAAFPSHGYDLSGNSSNALFRQLFAAEIIDTEMPFYAKIMNAIRPDGIIISKEALKKGEVGFAYISGQTTKGNPARPLLLCPLIRGTTKFDPKPFAGKAIVLRIDNTVDTYPIHKNGHVYDKDGLDILSPKHPIWKGKAPDIRYPE